jgi:tetratricopeptide (TPR) repeat protein
MIGVYSTSSLKSATIRLELKDETIFEKLLDLGPSSPFSEVVGIPETFKSAEAMTLSLLDSRGRVLVSYTPEVLGEVELPEPIKPHPSPEAIESVDEIWHHGDLIYKFRDPVRSRAYFEEALQRDSGNTRAHISLAELDIKGASYDTALQHLAKAEERDPDNGRIFYLRGLALEASSEYARAYNTYFRSVHFEDHLARAYHRIALLDLRNGTPQEAAHHAGRALENNLLNSKLWALKATALRLGGNLEKAETAIQRALKLDPIDPWAACEWLKLLALSHKDTGPAKRLLTSLFQWDSHLALETALEYADAGLYAEASALLQDYSHTRNRGSIIGYYYDAYFKDKMGQSAEAQAALSLAMHQSIEGVFSFRTDAIPVFETALDYHPKDGTAHYFLGLVYAKLGDLEKSISHWESAVQLVPDNPRAWRNLGLALLHGPKNAKRSLQCYEKAFALAPTDSRILLELDGTRQQLGEDPAQRLSFLKQNISTVESRDDLLKSMLDLMVRSGEYEEALVFFNSHHFKLWEGRYDIHNAYIDANLALARTAKNPQESLEYYQKACLYPENLEVAPREPNLRGFLYYPMATLNHELGNHEEAQRLLNFASEETSDFPTLGSYYQALALRDLGEKKRAESILTELRTVASALLEGKASSYSGEGVRLQKALGHFYLAKLEEATGNTEKVRAHLEQARSMEPMIEREAIMIAQRTYARAHQ